MKHILLLGFLFLNLLSVHAQHEFTIEGTIKGLEDGAVIGLYRSEGNLMSRIASDTLHNETFRFKEKATDAASEKLMLCGESKGFPNTWLDVWVAPNKKTTVSGNGKQIRAWAVKSAIKEQKAENEYEDAKRELTRQQMEIDIKNSDLIKVLQSEEASEAAKSAARTEVKQLEHLDDSLNRLITPLEIGIMKRTPVSRVWINKLEGLSMMVKVRQSFAYKDEVIAFYNRLSPSEKKSEIGKTITTYLFPPTIVKEGDEMADADLYDLEGNIHHLADYKGKFILIDFWSRGCGPCLMAIPEMKEISESNKDKLTLISISIDTKKSWQEATKTEGITWTNLNELQGINGLYTIYGVRGIPHYVLISPEGRIAHSWSGYGQGSLKRKLRKWMNPNKHPMTISQTEKTKTISYPKEKASNTEIVEIKQVELTDTATVVTFKAYYTPNYWIQISPDSHLQTSDGTSYVLKRAVGITPGQQFFMPNSGEAEFTLTFAPLPIDTKEFCFTEGDCDSCFQVTVNFSPE